MAESIEFSKNAGREVVYSELLPQINALIEAEPDEIANLANVAAVLKAAFGFFWVGFYLRKDEQLVLGPFQGPIACTRIDFGKGVCGHCYETKETVIVPDVDQFPGHIVCSSDAKSEIVVPIFGENDDVIGVLDIDSERVDDFSSIDAIGLGAIVRLLEENSKK